MARLCKQKREVQVVGTKERGPGSVHKRERPGSVNQRERVPGCVDKIERARLSCE